MLFYYSISIINSGKCGKVNLLCCILGVTQLLYSFKVTMSVSFYLVGLSLLRVWLLLIQHKILWFFYNYFITIKKELLRFLVGKQWWDQWLYCVQLYCSAPDGKPPQPSHNFYTRETFTFWERRNWQPCRGPFTWRLPSSLYCMSWSASR